MLRKMLQRTMNQQNVSPCSQSNIVLPSSSNVDPASTHGHDNSPDEFVFNKFDYLPFFVFIHISTYLVFTCINTASFSDYNLANQSKYEQSIVVTIHLLICLFNTIAMTTLKQKHSF